MVIQQGNAANSHVFRFAETVGVVAGFAGLILGCSSGADAGAEHHAIVGSGVLYRGQNSPAAIVVDDTDVYWGNC
jgi:hypothetical protein